MDRSDERHDVASSGSASAVHYVRRVTWVGLILNLALSAFKFVAGVVGQSQAVVADAVHSLSDSTTDVAVLIGSHYWSSPPDDDHPHGHARIETLVTTFIGVVILLAGVGIGWEALTSIHEQHPASPGWIAFLAAAVSLVCKEALYRWTAVAAKRVRSTALAANAWHHRLDALSSIPVLIAVGGAIALPSWSFLDRLGAAVVAIIILQESAKMIWAGLREFVDTGASTAARAEIFRIAGEHESVIQVHAVRTRHVASNLQVDMHVVVDGRISVSQGHDVAEEIEDRLLRDGPDVVDVVVHIEPAEEAVAEEDPSA